MRRCGRILFLLAILNGFLPAQAGVSQRYVVKLKTAAENISVATQRLERNYFKKNRSTKISKFKTAFQRQSKNRFPFEKYFVVDIDSSILQKEILDSVRSDPEVEYIQPSVNYQVYSIPNDSAYSFQWNLRRIGLDALFRQGLDLNTLPPTKVGVIDTGIDENHPDIQDAIAVNEGEIGADQNGNDKRSNGVDDDGNGFIDDWRGFDFVDLQSKDGDDWATRDNLPHDENGHGTGVAGIIGARSNNTIGISGFGPVKIIPLRAFSANGTGSDIDIASAVIYAADNGAEVINMSFGDVTNSLLLKDAIQYAYSKNVVLVASSGNDGSSKQHYPSDLNEVISVGSINSFDSRSIFSSHSPSLDIMAPGEFIPTTKLNGGYTDNFSGTSAAAPNVSGSIALLKSLEKSFHKTPIAVLSNEDYRGLLTTSADDVGDKGWDEFYASGVVNIEHALTSLKGSNVAIQSPKVDELVFDNFPIRITSISPYFKSVELYIGEGETPTIWTKIFSSEKQYYNDSITILDISSFINNIYVLRLIEKNSQGNDIESRNRILIQRQTPEIVKFFLKDSVIANDEMISLIDAETDIPTEGQLLYRKKNSNSEFSVLRSLTLGRNHYFALGSHELTPGVRFEFYTKFIENSARKGVKIFPTAAQTGFQFFEAQNPSEKFSTTSFFKIGTSLPSGFLLNDLLTIQNKPTLTINQYSKSGEFDVLKLFQLENGYFVQKDSINSAWIPRSFVRDDHGNPLLLVQNFGRSAIFSIDTTTMKFSRTPIWMDTSDVWGSKLVDLNGDLKPEIIARNSSEIMIYENLGNNLFALKTRLQNPSPPLLGESKNQFGPPKTLVGDFTNSGLQEIAFADYDGDLVVYRQDAIHSLSFSLASIDTSDLYEMSDFIAQGDYNGDGITDIAVAAHSNLDLNENREYDTPIWTVKIFSHAQSDIAGSLKKKWEQLFFGVKAGPKNDNGISSSHTLLISQARDALILNLNPNIYVFSFDNNFVPSVLWNSRSYSNNAISLDDKIGFNNGEETAFYQFGNFISGKPIAPWNFTVTPINGSSIQLSWNGSGEKYKIFRGTSALTRSLLDSTVNKKYIDSSVTSNQKYFYSIRSISNGGTLISGESSIDSTIPHTSATIQKVTQTSLYQIAVEFSFEMSSSSIQTATLLLDGTTQSNSAILGAPKQLIFSFDSPIAQGSHSLKINSLIDASGMQSDTNQIFSFVADKQEINPFFAQKTELLFPTKIKIEFNEKINAATANLLSNFAVLNNVRHFSVKRVDIDSLSPNIIFITTSATEKLNELALRIEINLSENIESISGKKLNEGKGQTVSIAQETNTLDNIVTFPNPVYYKQGGSEKITFVNLPVECKITVYTPSGIKVKEIQNKTTRDGLFWDLRDEKGNIVSSGVYIYRTERIDESGNVTQTKLGKFAVVKQ